MKILNNLFTFQIYYHLIVTFAHKNRNKIFNKVVKVYFNFTHLLNFKNKAGEVNYFEKSVNIVSP